MMLSANKFVLSAIKKKDVERALQLVLLPGYDINSATRRKITPLILATKKGLQTVVERLISLGADVTWQDEDGKAPLHHACYHGYQELVPILVKAGAPLYLPNSQGDHPLHEAVVGRHPGAVTAMLEAGCDVNIPNHVTGCTALELAVLVENSEIVSLLLENYANIHHVTTARESALHFAVQTSSTDIVRKLIDAGADINRANNIGETPLTISIQEKRFEMVKTLVQAGCKLYCARYYTPLCIACKQNDPKIIKYLLSEGYDPNRDPSIRRQIFIKMEEENMDLLLYIFHRCENPLSLKEQCRLVLRRALCKDLSTKVLELQIPNILKDWIVLDIIY